ncbi:MAG: hypothetical protein ACRDY0_10295 [Acidimicrobiales bacterium]
MRSLLLPLRVLAVAALAGVGADHLYLLGKLPYSMQPEIHPLFIATVATAFAFALLSAVALRWWIAVLAAAFAFSTLGGYVLAIELPKGIFSFRDVVNTPGVVAIVAESVAGVALLAWTSIWARVGRWA